MMLSDSMLLLLCKMASSHTRVHHLLSLQMKLYREYEREKKPVEKLSDEDKFVLMVCRK